MNEATLILSRIAAALDEQTALIREMRDEMRGVRTMCHGCEVFLKHSRYVVSADAEGELESKS